MRTKLIGNIAIALLTVCVAGLRVSEAEAITRFPLETGADLQLVCDNPANAAAISPAEAERLQICGAYIRGFLGYYSLVREKTKEPAFCLTAEGVSAEKVRVTFLELLGKRPQFRDLPVSVDLASSMAWAFPCKNNKKTPG